ncbi:hypothetical protein SIO17_01595 [Pseudoalteromonas piscicida]|uniref:Uncharacterized protein n=1 Tax=Pseudoalteromonas piscicida TaxID=43662 RepID=A0ABM6NA62_PSEO7|nr:hypothetical protein [Pseudoalteromonas piscicida]ATD05677.1 hypothetical protein PPIS_a0366 [Pseudoalteromonas piscicida]WPU32464.1 hypothetical protein SIO17_01595 [Pseudoalteromonas piscicida]
MNKFIATTLTCWALSLSVNASAESEHYDTSTLPLLFHAGQQGYQALSPWYSFQYQDQRITLQTCAEDACKQTLQFPQLEQTAPFNSETYEPSYQGEAGNMKKLESYSQLQLGYLKENRLYASGNQRRLLFTLQLASGKAELPFVFNDNYDESLTKDKSSLTRSSPSCAKACNTTWQAFSVDKSGQYSPAIFVRDETGNWLIQSTHDAIRIELTTLIGQYQPPALRHHHNDTTQSSYPLSDDSLIVTRQADSVSRHILNQTQVVGLSDKHWLLLQNTDLTLTDTNSNIQAKRPIAQLELSRPLASYLDNDRLYLLGLSPRDAVIKPSQQTIMTQYPKLHEDALVATSLLELDLELQVISATTVFIPDTEFADIRITRNAWGILVSSGEVSARSTTHTYESNQSASAMSGCPMIANGYGYGLLCWKALNNPTLTYTPNAASTMIPTTVVDNTTPNLMNQLENNQYGIIFKNGATPTDPGGVWTHPDNVATSKEDLGLAVAMYHYRWGSPVAANIVYPSGSPAQPVMFRKVEYQAANSSNLPHNVCNHFAASSGYPEYQAADACMTQPGFGLFSLEDLTFDRWQGGNYYPNQTVSGQDNSWFPWYTNFVGDPPVIEIFEQASSAEMLARLQFNLAQFGKINQDTYVNGTRFSQDTVTGFYRCKHQ